MKIYLYENKKDYLVRKRVFDRVFSLAALVLLFPAILLIALLIYADDPDGSPIFSQIRVGLNGKTFRMYKFRTMKRNAEALRESLSDRNEMSGPVFKIRNDERITRFGRFLRKSGLDEIPQFVNVLKGDMSVVGPRPPLPSEVREYTERQRLRLTVRPGITCYWQISPHRNRYPFDDWLELDLRYIREQSPATDRRIMLRTVLAMITMQGE